MSSAIFVMVAIMSPTVVVTTVDPGSLFAKETQMCARGERVGGGYYLVGWLLFPGRDRKQVEYLVIEAEPRKIKGFMWDPTYLNVIFPFSPAVIITFAPSDWVETGVRRVREREREREREEKRRRKQKAQKNQKGKERED